MSYNEITVKQLLEIMPAASAIRVEQFAGPLNAAMREFGIDTPKRQAAFIAQLAHESGCFRYVRELASGEAYNGRISLGNTRPEAVEIATRNNSTPGPFFKGRGLIQITGYDNYASCSKALFQDKAVLTGNPALLERPDLACRSAAWFWDSRSLNSFADAGDFEAITRKINGGLNGYADRIAYHQRALKVLAVDTGGGADASAPFNQPKQEIPKWLRSLQQQFRRLFN
jgi:putative chitinase